MIIMTKNSKRKATKSLCRDASTNKKKCCADNYSALQFNIVLSEIYTTLKSNFINLGISTL